MHGHPPPPDLAPNDPFYVMLDMPMGGGWPYDIPPSGHYDRYVDFLSMHQG